MPGVLPRTPYLVGIRSADPCGTGMGLPFNSLKVELIPCPGWLFFWPKKKPSSRWWKTTSKLIFFAQIFRIVRDGYETHESGVFLEKSKFGSTLAPFSTSIFRKYTDFKQNPRISLKSAFKWCVFMPQIISKSIQSISAREIHFISNVYK